MRSRCIVELWRKSIVKYSCFMGFCLFYESTSELSSWHVLIGHPNSTYNAMKTFMWNGQMQKKARGKREIESVFRVVNSISSNLFDGSDFQVFVFFSLSFFHESKPKWKKRNEICSNLSQTQIYCKAALSIS